VLHREILVVPPAEPCDDARRRSGRETFEYRAPREPFVITLRRHEWLRFA
jgi:hypothetical protein